MKKSVITSGPGQIFFTGWRCKSFGHQTGDKACPLYVSGNVQTERFRWVSKVYGKCSKIPSTSCLPKRSRQAGQAQISLLLRKQSDQDLPCLLF